MIIFFNPLSTTPGKQPLPLSVLSLAAALPAGTPWRLVDGNIEPDPASRILALADSATTREHVTLAVTVMPGPQVAQAVGVCLAIRATRPDVTIVWGGYFPTQHTDTVLASSCVDFVVRSQGERALVDLLEVLRSGGAPGAIAGLSWKHEGRVIHNPLGSLVPLDDLPDLPYDRVPMEPYLHRNYLGRRTAAHNSSYGCPFACGFCAVGAMARQRWVAQSPARVEQALSRLVRTYGVDAVQMHDMDLFISESRAGDIA
jgi:radical SAM superfamily enzyme YgiQ (UPF0313 family)